MSAPKWVTNINDAVCFRLHKWTLIHRVITNQLTIMKKHLYRRIMILKLIFQVQLYYLMNENIIDTIHIIIYFCFNTAHTLI